MKFNVRFFVGVREFGGPYHGKLEVAFGRQKLARTFTFVCRLAEGAVELTIEKEHKPFCAVAAASNAFSKTVERECTPEQQAIIVVIAPHLFDGMERIMRRYPDDPAGRFEFEIERIERELRDCNDFVLGYEVRGSGVAKTRQQANLLRAACA